MMKKIFLIGITTLSLTACNIYKPYIRPQIQPEKLYGMEYSVNDTLSMASLSWKEVFTDTILQNLIKRALQKNTDMQSALLRIDEAKATLTAARLAFLPSFALAPQGNISSLNSNKPIQTFQLPLTASWQLDIFGSKYNAKKQANALYAQSKDYAQAVNSQLMANVANAYYTLLMLDSQLEIAKATEKSWQESLKSTYALKLAGKVTEAAVAQTEATCQSVAISILDLKELIAQTENSLCLLMAESPHPIERSCIDEQKMTSFIKIGVPMQLLTNRPDVRIAERSLESALYATNQARTAFYPNIILSGNMGWTNAIGELIANPEKFLVSAIGSLVQPLFTSGQLTARLKIAKATQERATLNFRQSLLNAGTEVNNALSQFQTASAKFQLYEQQITSLQSAVRNTELLMQHGDITYLEVLAARQSLYDAELNKITNQMEQLQAMVNLYQALGGSQ